MTISPAADAPSSTSNDLLYDSMTRVDQPIEQLYVELAEPVPNFKKVKIVGSLGGSGESYKVCRAAALRRLVSEVVSP